MTTADTICVQSVIELMKDVSEYGPFKIMIDRHSGGNENVRVYKDGNILGELDINGLDIEVCYMREDPHAWEELCVIANAHAMIEKKPKDC